MGAAQYHLYQHTMQATRVRGYAAIWQHPQMG